MSKVTLFLRSISLCFYIHALQTGGVRLRHTFQEVLELHPINRNGGSMWDEPFFAVHETSSGGPYDNYYGLHATMGVYNHTLNTGQRSSTAIWVYHTGNGAKPSLNLIQVGWHTSPDLYGDSNPHFYTQWTRDHHDATGCYNMECPGFVRAYGATITPGDSIQPGVPDGNIPNITLRVLKDKISGDWWVYYGYNSVPTGVGYYPSSLFTDLADKASQMAFGGAVIASRTLPTPPMGSGSLPNDGQGHAAAFTDLRIIDQDGNSKPLMVDLPMLVTNDKCHSITPIDNGTCLYGGPGNCVR